jgi:hypothetical protein
MTAVAPAWAMVSRPSGNGKKASEGGDGALERKNGLHRAKPRSVDPAHLARSHPYRLAVPLAEAGVDDRVRLDVLAHAPGKEQRTGLLRGGLAFGDDLRSASVIRRRSAS